METTKLLGVGVLCVVLSAGLGCADQEDIVPDSGTPPEDTGVAAQTPSMAGQLVITEIMPSALGTGEDWIEIHNPSDTVAYDLNGCAFIDDVGKLGPANESVDQADFTSTLVIPPGGYIVLAETGDATTLGFTPDWRWSDDGGQTWGLSGGGESPAIICDGTIIDTVTYAAATAGTAWNLDPSATDAASNDDFAANWCEAQNEYQASQQLDGGTGADGGVAGANLGTPGDPNTTCP